MDNLFLCINYYTISLTCKFVGRVAMETNENADTIKINEFLVKTLHNKTTDFRQTLIIKIKITKQ